MKRILPLLIVIYIVFCSLTTNAQLYVYSVGIIDELSFCSSPTETVSITLDESKTSANKWAYYFVDGTNTISLKLDNDFTFGNDSEPYELEVQVQYSEDISIT